MIQDAIQILQAMPLSQKELDESDAINKLYSRIMDIKYLAQQTDLAKQYLNEQAVKVLVEQEKFGCLTVNWSTVRRLKYANI